MRIAEVQFISWDKVYHFSSEDESLKIGDSVLVNTELGREIGKVVNDGAKVVSTDISIYDENLIVDASKMLEREWSPSAIMMFSRLV